MTFLPEPFTVLRASRSTTGASAALVSGTVYATYLGFVQAPIIPKFLEMFCGAVGTGAQTAEGGFFSTPAPPNKSAQVLTKLVAGAMAAIGANAPWRNNAAFATTIPGGTFLWGVVRCAFATTQPTLESFMCDCSQGWVLTAAGIAVLTGLATINGVIPATAIGGGAISPGNGVGVDCGLSLV